MPLAKAFGVNLRFTTAGETTILRRVIFIQRIIQGPHGCFRNFNRTRSTTTRSI